MKRIEGQTMASEHFSFDELGCRHCGFFHFEDAALHKLERLRLAIGAPFRPISACRCPLHNAFVGGAPFSSHRATEFRAACAIDIPLVVDKRLIIEVAEQVGFLGIGVGYASFVHVDNRMVRARW